MSMKLQMVRGLVAATLLSGVGVAALVQAQRPGHPVVCNTTTNTHAVLLPTVVIDASPTEQLPRLATSDADVCRRIAAPR